MPTQAVLYCRVSSARQVIEGNGLASQENNCRNYALLKGYTVLGAFHDGITGESDDRRGLQAMLAFLKTQLPGVVVIIDDLKRFAREVEVHFALKRAIGELGARLESPLFRFEDTPEGKFIETIVAAQAELERNQNKRQVLSRMRARLEMGFWTFPPPIGYQFEKHSLHKKIIVPTPAARKILGPALEAFAIGRLQTQRELGLHLQEQGFFTDTRPVSVTVLEKRMSRMMDYLPLYAGQLEYPTWKIERRPAHHEAILSPLGLARIEEKLFRNARPIGADRADKSARLPLRNFIRCASCGRPLTGSIAKGRYPRYHCYYHHCPKRGHSLFVRRVDTLFISFLDSLTPSQELLEALGAYLPKVWQKRNGERGQVTESLKQELSGIQREIQGYVRRLGRASDAVADEIEQEVEGLKLRELEVRRQLVQAQESGPDIESAWEAVGTYFKRPIELWENGSEKEKKTLLRMIFAMPPTFSLEKGVGTPNLSLPYQVFKDFGHTKKDVVDLPGESWHEFFTTILLWYEWIRTDI